MPLQARRSFDVAVLLGRGMPLGEQEQLLATLGQDLVASGAARAVEVAFVEVTRPSLDEVLMRLEREGVTRCVVVPVIVPFDRNLRGWIGRALSSALAQRAFRMQVVLADAPDQLDVLTPVVAAQVAAAEVKPDVRAILKPLKLKPGASRIPAYRHIVNVCLGPRCAQAGGWQVFDQFKQRLGVHGSSRAGIGDCVVIRTACQGPCNYAPLVNVQPDNVWYGTLGRAEVDALVDGHLMPYEARPLDSALRSGDRLRLSNGELAEPDQPKVSVHRGPIRVDGLFARAAMRHERSLAVFMELTNTDGPDDALLSVDHSATRRIALHDARVGHADLTAGFGFPLSLRRGTAYRLVPGELHLMILDLLEVPDPGERIKLTLRFERAGAISAECFVHSPG